MDLTGADALIDEVRRGAPAGPGSRAGRVHAHPGVRLSTATIAARSRGDASASAGPQRVADRHEHRLVA